MRLIKTLLLISLTLIVTACTSLRSHGIIQDRGTDYLKDESIPPLKIPPGLSSSTIHAEYPVSDDGRYTNSHQDINLIPPGLNNPGK